MYEQPIMNNLEYMWRLDTDSNIVRAIGYDIFKYMKENGLKYASIWATQETGWVVWNLWEAVCK